MSLEHLDSKTQEELETKYMTVEVSEEAKNSDMTLPNLETMPPIKLVALDMDGTTLREDKTFSERLIKVVHKIQEMGVTVAICTGRAPESIQGFAKTLGLDKGHGYCVCFNGPSLINLDDINQDSPKLAILLLWTLLILKLLLAAPIALSTHTLLVASS